MQKEKDVKGLSKKVIGIIGVMAVIIIILIVVLMISGGKDKVLLPVEEPILTNEEVITTESLEEEPIFIDHPIVGKWKFYTDINEVINSEWILVFNKDGTYFTDSSPVEKEGAIANKEIYSYGTYSVNSTNSKEELVYFHEGHQKTLDVDFLIEYMDGVEQLSFYWSNGGKITAGSKDGNKIYETFVRVTED